jgi:hypothetical protein
MRKDDKLTELIFSRQLVSVMNRTKWRELATVITSRDDFTPKVRVRYVDGYAPEGFSYLDWEWVRLGDARVIERLDIDPIKREYVGRLVKQVETDFSEWIRQVLSQHSIAFEEVDKSFRINAYLLPSSV